ncbi:hypothetical protein L6164_022112 [Bauhinia variegata]|uniref:Uncharacterized protein n=1 Tax=Bauhinia variegata TaxID=167791 RepID=A0ACB9MFY7_BAUVA|nr:hypothetical protein L6164_022112 [Bauhinia variegata]
MISSGNNNLSSSSGVPSSDMPPLPQCLPLDPITLGNQKYTRSGELRRVLGVPLGSTSEDHSKPMPPVASGELKHFKESVQDASRKARDRAKRFRENIFKLDKYREALSSKKRQRTDLSSDRGGGVNLTKMGSQIHRNTSDTITQRSEAKTTSPVLNKRIRTSVADVRMEGKSAVTVRQHMGTDKDGTLVSGGSSVRIEEKTRRLLAGGEGLDQKIKKKRSVGAVGNRVITGDRDVKRVTLPKMGADLKLRFYDAQGFRLKSLHGASGINKSEGPSEPTNSGVRSIPGGEQEGASLQRDHMTASEQRVLTKGNNRPNSQEDYLANSPNSTVKGKISRATRTGSVTALEMPNVQPSSGTFPGSSMHPMTQWVGQRPHKNSRTRRANVVSPVSRNVEAQVSPEGCPTSDSSVRPSVGTSGSQLASITDNGTQKYKRPPDDISSPLGFESEESGAGEIKLKEKGMNNSEFEKAGVSKLQIRKNKIPMDESADCVQREGRNGRGSSLIRPGHPSVREKSENLPALKPVENMRPIDKSRAKHGRPPSKKQKDRMVLTRIGKVLNNVSSDFAGESDDDHEELYQAANFARNASNLACAGTFWYKMEPIFASASLEDSSYLEQQLNFAEEHDENLSEMLGVGHSLSGVLINNDAARGSGERQRSFCGQELTKTDTLSRKSDMEKLDKVTPLFQRILSALIEEDEVEESYHHSEINIMSRQSASDDSHCGSCNQIDFEPKDRDKMDSEVESKVDLHIQKNCMLDRLSCDKSAAASNTFRCPNTSSSLQSTGVWQGDEEFSHSDITHNSEICSNDFDQPQNAELSVPGFPSSDGQYELMCLDDRLLLELQSIGLYPEILPDLAEEDEAINQDIVELNKGLHQQIGRKKKNLSKIGRAVQKGRDAERRKIEQVAFDKLTEIAYRKRLACNGSKYSKGAVQKVSKQVALPFLKRTLARCKKYEETGNSCFSEPALQSIMFSPPPRDNYAKSADCIVSGTASNTCNKASHQMDARKSGTVSSASEKYDSHSGNAYSGFPDSFQDFGLSSEQVSSKNGSPFIKEKREMLVNGVFGGSSSRTSNLDGAVHGGAKGKRSERDRNNTKQNSISRAGSGNEYKTKTKSKQKNNHIGHEDRFTEAKKSIHGSSQPVASAGNNVCKEGAAPSNKKKISSVKESTDIGNSQLNELDPIEELGVSGEFGEHQDLSSWLNFDEDGLQDHDCIGLEIPMDDLSELNFV